MLQCRSSLFPVRYSLLPSGMWQAGGKARKLAQCAMDKRLRIFRDFGHKRLLAGSALECGPALRDRFPSPEACFRQHLEQAQDKKAAAPAAPHSKANFLSM